METADAGIITEPPVLTHKTDRTHCEHCKVELHPDVYHKCAGNEEYKPVPPMLPDLGSYSGKCPRHEGPDCKLCGGTGVIE